MTKKTTIQDIADALGLSRNTVSKAINNAPGLAVYTRDRILQKAVEMGYISVSRMTCNRLHLSGQFPCSFRAIYGQFRGFLVSFLAKTRSIWYDNV